ncbi:SusC/RagA family TonB-linked outer membrane protein [Dyadobacter chenwenxiniae]|uniref:SusC/RagA family TonB-linked outer membrane protein n=1 Tax=Dyadobacter chenwenxiniae TaxID=2906456 RepID=A0A9X1PKY4_9BACT|nr:SusC/RagA family TonB-linked outer membrane protein [Dyadobacter chenwenxiniae]MCF0063000.1 SusC/RagA family TonB-linked outer membrane protein [Dyadobacter chenwenxiniae]UON84826.1 SusC/RagA family TonB-linked outer membrane protein [Dyadobacter chenwenxiniae]
MKKHRVLPRPFYGATRIALYQLLIAFIFANISASAIAGAQDMLNQKVTIQVNNQEIKAVLNKLNKLTQIRFTYNSSLIRHQQRVSVNAVEKPLAEVLDQLFKPLNITYKIEGKQVVLLKGEAGPESAIPAAISDPTVDRTITGKVSDEKGQPLPGVSIVVKSTKVGTATNTEGTYELSVPDAGGVLIFSYVGYTPEEVTIGSQSTYDLSMKPDVRNLEMVVVTALGIKRDAKKLGYSTATVNTEELTTNRTTNLGNSLQGKVAGLNVTPPASGPGGSTKIRIRGQSSFGGNNSPLIIVNGVPINNSSVSAGGSAGNGTGNPTGGSSDAGDGLQSINQDDIESMTVLKGAAAAALYGFRAKDGAIIITTKSGSKSTGIGVELNSNFQAQEALDYTDFQYEYGQGEFGKRPTNTAEAQSSGVFAFGEKLDGKPTPQFDGSTQPYVANKDRIKDFYRTGTSFTNSVALSGGNDKGNFRLSFANTDAKAIMPNSDYHKRIFNLGLNYKFTPKLSAQVNANYSNEYNKNPPQIGIQDMNANTTIYTLATSIDADWLKNRKDANGNEMPLSRFTNRNNPYWVAYDRFENVRRDRIFGNTSVRYDFTDWLFVQGRISQDYFTRPYNYNRPTGTRSIGAVATGFNGYYYQDIATFRERNADILIGANRTFGDFGIDLTLGGNQMLQISDNVSTAVTNFYVRDLYTITNGQVKNPNYNYSKKKVNSIYGAAEFSYKNFLYINVTARNDWFSTLNPQSNSYLYPSVSGSFVFSQAFANAPNWLTYGKLRAAYAEVGGDTDPYSDNLYYGVNANPFNGTALGNLPSAVSPNANLRPLKVKETEVGIELKTFDNRLNLDLSLYRKNTVDEILNVDISNTSGFSQTKVNVGKLRNQGVEFLLTIVPVKTDVITWETSFNGSYNISKVIELAPGPPRQLRFDVGSGEFFGIVSHEVDKPLASLRGFDYKRDTQGRIITSGGLPQQGNLITYGSAIPKWVGAWVNSFNVKGVRIGTQIDFKAGNKILSNSNLNFLREGLSKPSLIGREGGVLLESVTNEGAPNTTRVEAEQFYTAYRSTGIATPFVYNGAFVRWRSITLGYDLSRFLRDKTFIKGLTISAMCNNVLMIKKNIDNLDPEAQVSASDNLQGIETHTLPTTRSYGVNLNIKL